ncbi:type II secretion system protein [Puniceicoccus vermicola]|uniref:Type II secretion system protein n=1 Tax=Puniceicoccus vermicola TaxID=388746 RepID=A0A7X1AWP5_9BACT|nr:type II secretion system protein [Puniceicoccus vermicola]MBC2600195.1 type II secretion system protein [Puniceicoccus vermicola]
MRFYRRPHSRLTRYTGFTLVEILVAIAIIGLLAGIISAVTHKSIESARLARCQSNLRQIGNLFHLYANDNDGRFPYQITSRENGALAWDFQLMPYANSYVSDMGYGNAHEEYLGERPPGIFACPASSKDSRGTTQLSNYGVNGTLVRRGNASPAQLRPQVKVANIVEPAKTYLAADSNQRTFTHYSRSDFTEEPADAESAADRHVGVINMLFVDGHVETLTLDQIDWSDTAAGVADRAPWGAN